MTKRCHTLDTTNNILTNKAELEQGLDTLSKNQDNFLQSILEKNQNTIDSLISLAKSIEAIEPLQNEESLWGMPVTTAGIVISTFLTIFIFSCGYLISWLKTKYDKKSELENIKSIIMVWLELLKKPLEAQARNCRDFAIRLRHSSELQSERISINLLMANKLQKLELNDIMNAVVLNSKGDETTNSKMLFKLVSQIDLLSKIESNILSSYNLFGSRLENIMERWNIKFAAFDDTKRTMVTEIANKKSHPAYDLMIFFVRHSNRWLDKYPKGANIVQCKVELLDELNKEVVKTINKFPNEPLPHRLSENIQSLYNIFREWEIHFEGNAKIFYDFTIRFIQIYKDIKDVKTHIEETELESFIKMK